MTHWRTTLEDLAHTRRPALVGYAFLLTGDQREVEDLVHDAFVRTFTRARSDITAAVAEAYLRRTIRNAFIDDYRRRTRWSAIRHLFVSGDAPAPDEMTATEDRLTITDALDVLSPRERACIVLRYYEDLTLAQIANELNLATGSVKRYLADANRKLGLTFELSDDGLDIRPADGDDSFPDIGPEETPADSPVTTQPGRPS